MAVPQQTVIKLLYAARKKKRKKMEKSSFVNKLSGQALKCALITLYFLKVNIILHLQSSDVYLKIARLIF